MVRQWQEFFYDKRYVATPLVAPDFAALANAFGIRGERITKRAEVVPSSAPRVNQPKRCSSTSAWSRKIPFIPWLLRARP